MASSQSCDQEKLLATRKWQWKTQINSIVSTAVVINKPFTGFLNAPPPPPHSSHSCILPHTHYYILLIHTSPTQTHTTPPPPPHSVHSHIFSRTTTVSETGPISVVQACFKLVAIFTPHPTEGWKCKHKPPCPTWISFLTSQVNYRNFMPTI